jgi:hypothetical protein
MTYTTIAELLVTSCHPTKDPKDSFLVRGVYWLLKERALTSQLWQPPWPSFTLSKYIHTMNVVAGGQLCLLAAAAPPMAAATFIQSFRVLSC